MLWDKFAFANRSLEPQDYSSTWHKDAERYNPGEHQRVPKHVKRFIIYWENDYLPLNHHSWTSILSGVLDCQDVSLSRDEQPSFCPGGLSFCPHLLKGVFPKEMCFFEDIPGVPVNSRHRLKKKCLRMASFWRGFEGFLLFSWFLF